jgi:hypothetical protein
MSGRENKDKPGRENQAIRQIKAVYYLFDQAGTMKQQSKPKQITTYFIQQTERYQVSPEFITDLTGWLVAVPLLLQTIASAASSKEGQVAIAQVLAQAISNGGIAEAAGQAIAVAYRRNPTA